MLECNHLNKRYFRTVAINDVSLGIEKGKIYTILGPNGSGKTTFMKIVAGLIKPTSGEITFEGHPIGAYSKAHVAYMSTEPFYYSYMTVKDVGKYYCDFFEDFSQSIYEKLIDAMELPMSKKSKDMSSGMAAKHKIAATLARDASLIMLDEPLNGIDIIARELIISTIVAKAKPTNTIILSSHLVDELEKIIDNAIFLKQGNLVLAGSADRIRAEHGKSIVDMYREIYATHANVFAGDAPIGSTPAGTYSTPAPVSLEKPNSSDTLQPDGQDERSDDV
jgi:ABC-2 type transport system ATP-binding protein